MNVLNNKAYTNLKILEVYYGNKVKKNIELASHPKIFLY